MKDDQALRWMRDAARVVSRGHAIEPDELLSEMIVSLGEKGLAPITSKAAAERLARWRLADWQRHHSARSRSRGRGLAMLEGVPLAECKERWQAEQPKHEEPVEPAASTPQMCDMRSLDVWRRLFEREQSRKLGATVRLGDRRVKEMLRQRALQIRDEAPELGLELLEIASEPTVVCQRQGPRSRGIS